MRFLDSYRFMNKSLCSLARNLKPEQLTNNSKYFPNSEQFKLVTRKGIFPYMYVDSFEKLSFTNLPDKIFFNNTINNSSISDDDYKHAQKLWKEFNCQVLSDYSDIYLKTDELLLADVFENFRELCINIYDLNPC